MRYYLTVGLLAVASVGASAQTYNFSFDGRDKTGIQLTANDLYDAQKGYGFDFVDIVKDSPLISERFDKEVRGTKGTAPFFLSVNVPDGNYKVTVTLGAKKQRGNTVVRAESRRLMLEDIETKKGEFKTYSFVVNKRNTEIWGTERGSSERKVVDRVRIKEREKTKLNWDDKLTLEVSGEQPACSSIRIEPAPASVPTVFLCGNSTVVDQDYEPWASWGQMIPRWFDDGVAIANYGESGETAEARSRKATIVFVTPTQRRSFDGEGHIRETHGDYPDAMRAVARREQVPVIELHDMTRTLFETMGVEGSKKALVHYPANTYPGQLKALEDNTHFNPYGAYAISKMIVEGMKQIGLPIVSHLRSDYTLYDPSKPDAVETFHWVDSPFTEALKPDGN